MQHSKPGSHIAVARGEGLVIIRIIGSGNMLNATALADFAEAQRNDGFRSFVFDLGLCRNLDSTFMGVMVGLHTSLMAKEIQVQTEPQQTVQSNSVPQEQETPTPMAPQEAVKALKKSMSQRFSALSSTHEKKADTLDGIVSAVNVSPQILEVMRMLGVDKFVNVGKSCDLAQLETTILPERDTPAQERRMLILKAHETLVMIDKRNLDQFGPFLKSLAEELSNNQKSQ